MSGREVVPLSAATVDLLRDPCRGCVRWLRDPVEARASGERRSVSRQREWAGDVTRRWGPPGVVVRVEGRTVAHAVAAPSAFVPRAAIPATAPVSADAVLLLSLSSESRVHTKAALHGLVRQVVRRQVRAIEAYGGPAVVPGCLSGAGPGAALHDLPWPPPDVCRIPTRLLTDIGFVVVREHPTTPRLRLDLRTVATVAEDVTAALRRLVPERTTAPAAT
ncbi:hypothetical protein [Arsenicicoccus sp. oral taxon 190]|uniref:hypothetical protein n=1 Tax=Arsenicicoccus sp. oral taxon 190 TaxID=1658671 RepID=UPI000679F4FB|nr:hypothetical protein [Arsenicicoccus sp. oral taxon 190]AKT50861.1 hypothetical protein ADJ73_05285 [Arsenicicoccus sp. oral taxon 190]